MERISSKENKNIKEYVKLASKKKYRDEQSMFVIEGVKLIQEAFKSNIKFEIVFVTQVCMQKYQSELEKLFQATTTYLIDQNLENKLSQSPSPQGIYAICNKSTQSLDFSDIISGGKFILLEDLQDNGNVGTIIRTAEAVGINGVILSDLTCDVYSLKTIRATMGSLFRMPILIQNDITNFISKLNQNGVQTLAAVVDPNADDLLKTNFSDNLVVLIGNEGNGLSQACSQNCSRKITIKMKGKAESLNASMAAALIMWEITK